MDCKVFVVASELEIVSNTDDIVLLV